MILQRFSSTAVLIGCLVGMLEEDSLVIGIAIGYAHAIKLATMQSGCVLFYIAAMQVITKRLSMYVTPKVFSALVRFLK